MWMCIRPETKCLTCLCFHPNGNWLCWEWVCCVQLLCLIEKIESYFFGMSAKYLHCSNTVYWRVDWSTTFAQTPWNSQFSCGLASWSVWTSLHRNLRLCVACGLWTLEIQQHFCPNTTEHTSWNCLVVLHFCWFENMHRLWHHSGDNHYLLNYHSFSKKGYYFTY
jgi:hypothetical protein